MHLFSKHQVRQLIKYTDKNQEPIFIITHLFGLKEYIKYPLKSKNIYFNISAPSLISLNKAIEYFGAERILLGSDTPFGPNSLEVNIKRIKNLDIDDTDKELIFGKNFRKILNQ